MKYKTFYKSPLGNIFLISDGEFLEGLYFENQHNYPFKYKYTENNDLQIFQETKKWLTKYFNKENPGISKLKLNLIGKNFSKIVWQSLLEIPYGFTKTYGEIANIVSKKINKKISPQLIGWIISRNPISIIFPCHRVVGKNGNLIGYAGGINRKLELLQLEKL